MRPDPKTEVEKLRAERRQLFKRLPQIERQIQELCDHKWEWHQIAGEGKICHKCGARDFDCED